MIILRALWALFLAGFVAYAFRRTWKWEHGAPMPETIWGSDITICAAHRTGTL